MSLLAGRTLGPYEIVSLLGSGGMGEVYEARDTRLQRRVALKTLRPELLVDPHARRRFEREARTLSSLSHPNICTVFDVGHVDGIDFIVMEYIEGSTLAALLDRKTLTEATLVRYGEQIAEALAEAHDHGVLHRDIKPQNVMVTSRDHVKVLDFGLAKAVTSERSDEAATASVLSDAAIVVGTAPYMSPEQVRGEAVDARSDAFSLGSLLYEAIAGRPPFQAPTAAGVMSAILTSDPVPLARAAPDTSPELQRIVRKCLEKERSRRYQTLRDVATDLENLRRDSTETARAAGLVTHPEGVPLRAPAAWTRPRVVAAGTALLVLVVAAAAAVYVRLSTPASPTIRSMAVLPLRPLTSTATENYLGLGIADAVIMRLSGTSDLIVRPTSAVRRYAAADADALKAGAELQVDAVLDGTWQRDQERFRLSVNLLRVSDGASLWAESFDTADADPFAMQDRVSQQVAARLRLQLNPERRARLQKSGTRSSEAYDAYVRGQFYFSDRSAATDAARKNLDAAIQLFERAITLDPDYADAHAKLGYAYAWKAVFMEDSRDLIERAKQQTRLAEALAPGLGQIHLTKGFVLWSWSEGWRLAEAIPEYRRAEQLDPSLADPELTSMYAHLGLLDLFRRSGQRLMQLDPMNQRVRENHVNEYYLVNLPEEALALQKRLLNTGPDGRYFLLTRRLSEAAPLVERNAAANPDAAGAQVNLALLRALQGRHAEARQLVDRVLPRAVRNRSYHHVTYTIARVFALAGSADEAAKWLQETIDWGFPAYPVFSTDSSFDPVRNAAAVQRVLTDLKAKWDGYVALSR